MKLPKMLINRHLKSDAGNVYNACYKDNNILLYPITQIPSGNQTYMWRLTHEQGLPSAIFYSAKLALTNAVETINKKETTK